ncbi:hypothetical protein JMUB3934_1583 [Leptotrichia wadei]|uniref:Uncharacterized protein n=1 Tax=Leptotrichia wadei TaxID=157687 RepID=A0A510KJR6_9FUSO|nr:hypothetical protein JMUB3934_1583 [Leptotrichia wadei]
MKFFILISANSVINNKSITADMTIKSLTVVPSHILLRVLGTRSLMIIAKKTGKIQSLIPILFNNI